MLRYKIAGHVVVLDAKDGIDIEEILPSFRPFKLETETTIPGEVALKPVLTVHVSRSWRWKETGREIGQFDVGGCNHGVYRTKDGGYQFEVSNENGHLCASMETNVDFSDCYVRLEDGTWYEQNYGLNNCMMMSYAFATCTMCTILLHASVIRCDGKGYLMTAPSGTGKSTHTHLWYTTIPGCDLMNDDNPVIRVVDGKPIIYGSPWSGKTPCYRNIEAPIGGIVRIQQRPENTIRQLKPVEAFAMLLPACSSMKWDERVYRSICDNITKFIETVRMWELGCLPNSEAAILCHDTISC